MKSTPTVSSMLNVEPASNSLPLSAPSPLGHRHILKINIKKIFVIQKLKVIVECDANVNLQGRNERSLTLA